MGNSAFDAKFRPLPVPAADPQPTSLDPDDFANPDDAAPVAPQPDPVGDQLCREALEPVADQLGRAAMELLERFVLSAIYWARIEHEPALGEFTHFAAGIVTDAKLRFFRLFKRAALKDELEDQQARDALVPGDEASLVRYLQYADRLLARHQGIFRRRWTIPGTSPEDFRAHCMVKLIELVAVPSGFVEFEHPGRAATLVVCDKERNRLRRDRKLSIAVPLTAQLLPESPSAEEQLLRLEHQHVVRQGVHDLTARATKPQRRWLEVFMRDLDMYGTVHRSAAAHDVQRHKSNATRALRALQGIVPPELKQYLELRRRRR
jgi:hypothetical protein